MSRRKRDQNRSIGGSSEMTPEEFTSLGYTQELLDKLPATQFEANQITRTGKGDVTIAGFHANAAGLSVPDDVTLEDIDEAALLLFAMEGRLQLWIGDLLNAAEQLEYGAIKNIAEKFNRDPQTLYNWKALSSSVTISLRRELLQKYPDAKPLSKSHYEMVQALSEYEQEEWLSQALENNWSVKELGTRIKDGENGSSSKERMKPWQKKIAQLSADFEPEKWLKLSESERREARNQLQALLLKLEEMGFN